METWYVLETGEAVDPKDVAPDASGHLVHKSGVKVAMRGAVPSSRGVDVACQGDRSVARKRGKTREIVAAQSEPGYETR